MAPDTMTPMKPSLWTYHVSSYAGERAEICLEAPTELALGTGGGLARWTFLEDRW